MNNVILSAGLAFLLAVPIIMVVLGLSGWIISIVGGALLIKASLHEE
jgi:hypothetical protein